MYDVNEKPDWLRFLPEGVDAVPGLETGVASAGLKAQSNDLALFRSANPGSAAAVYTTNAFRAAPLLVTKQSLSNGIAQAVVVNSGNANACTGTQGWLNARAMAERAAQAMAVHPDNVVVASTGLIGRQLPMDKVFPAIDEAAKDMAKHGQLAAEAIMTTDRRPKNLAVGFQVGDLPFVLGGVAKGAGMICPNMATALAFIFTDAHVTPPFLYGCLKTAVRTSFNAITVDADMSTNDMVAVIAGGIHRALTNDEQRDFTHKFSRALIYLCAELAKMVVQDGEGASRFVEITVRNAADARKAQEAARAVANSLLVKTAIHGGDPNWGRIACALGASGVHLDPAAVDIFINDILVMQRGMDANPDIQALRKAMQEPHLRIAIDLRQGDQTGTVWTCDLSEEYVTANAEYTT